MKTVSVVPNTILLNSLRDVGYTETMAICDIIDNSIDAKAKNIDVIISSTKNKVTEISISDDGDGMNQNTLIQSLTLGSNVTRATNALGHYGMGLKTAGLALATEINVLTKKSNKIGAYEGVFDLKSMITNNMFSISVGKSTKKTIGTVITLKDIDKLTSATAKTYTKNLTEKIAEVFTKILNTVNITINGVKVIADDLFLENVSQNYNYDTNGLLASPYAVKFKVKGVQKIKDVKIDLWRMPLNGKPTNQNNQKNQGFYVFRNGRLIASGQDLGIYTKHADLNYFRGAIYFNNIDDVKDAIGLNFSKQGVNFNDELSQDLHWKLSGAIKKIKADIQAAKAKVSVKNNAVENTFAKWFSKIFKHNKGIAAAMGIANGKTGVVASTGNVPPPVKPPKTKVTTTGIMTQKPGNTPVVKKVTGKTKNPPTPSTPNKNSKNPMQTGTNTVVKITKLPLGKTASFWKFEDLGGAVEIILNIDHSYYQKKYLGMSDIKKEILLETVVVVARGFIEAGLVNDDNEDMIEEMFNSFGDDYRQFV